MKVVGSICFCLFRLSWSRCASETREIAKARANDSRFNSKMEFTFVDTRSFQIFPFFCSLNFISNFSRSLIHILNDSVSAIAFWIGCTNIKSIQVLAHTKCTFVKQNGSRNCFFFPFLHHFSLNYSLVTNGKCCCFYARLWTIILLKNHSHEMFSIWIFTVHR